MANFDAAFDQQRAFAIWAWIACNHVTDIGNLWQRQIAFPVDPKVMFAVNVSACAKITHHGNGAINDDWNGHIDWA